MPGTQAPKKPKKKERSFKPTSSLGPVPMLGETQLQFFLRASRALKQSIPSINQRTLKILEIWKKSANDQDLRSKASAAFPADKFAHFGPRCIFLQHTIPAIPASEDGSRDAIEEIKYGQEEIQQLVDFANYRIRNSGTFSAISDGHTPSKLEKSNGAPDPEVLGYTGPFYLGLLGDIDPVWAIYADEWVHTQDVDRFMKLQRRSPEVWAYEPMESRTMDPVAALGAVTPGLDSGMNPYCRASDGRMVMKYSAATLPGPNNCFTPSAEQREKHRYSGESAMPPVENQNPDLAAIVGEAIQAVLPSIVEAVVAKINGGTDGETPPGDTEEPEEITDPGEADESEEITPRGSDVPVAEGGDDTPPPNPEPEKTMDPEEQKYKAMGPQCYEAYQAGLKRGGTPAKYSKGTAPGGGGNLSVIVARQSTQLKEQAAQLKKLEQGRVDAVRYSKLTTLANEFAFDPKEEFETCQDMTDPQFTRHCEKTITKYSKRDDVTGVELPDDLEPSRYSRSNGSRISAEQVERYSREAASVAVRKNAAKRGSTTFEAEFDEICKKNGVSV